MSPRIVPVYTTLSEAKRDKAAANPATAIAMLEQDVCVQRVERDTRQ